MMLRRTLVGVGVVAALFTWATLRPDANQARAGHADGPEVEAVLADESPDGNRDEALHRFRANQSRHWRHVMIGGGR